MKVKMSCKESPYKHLTVGKVYEVTENEGGYATIVFDDGTPCIIHIPSCNFLNGDSWIVMEE